MDIKSFSDKASPAPWQILVHPFGPAETNATLIVSSQDRTVLLFDCPLGSCSYYSEWIAKEELKLLAILMTHSHWDHILDAAVWKKTTGAVLYIHELDAPNLRNPGCDRLPIPFPCEGVEPDLFLTDGQSLVLGQFQLEILHTPGHSPGGVCFYLKAQNWLISGDTLFRGAIGALHSPTGQASQMERSLARLAELPPDTQVFPGHGNSTTIGREAQTLRCLVK